MNMKRLGGGCASSEKRRANTKESIGNLGIDAEVEYITDFNVIGNYAVMSMPALVVDEKVVSTGKVLKSKEIEKLLK